ncbi:MAG TPA: amidohydrolase [Flavobacteriales bacterium]|nr:amidohydrolase [Flavobacteriales bacterium]
MATITTLARLRAAALTVLLGWFLGGCYHSQEADLVIHNARIHSVDANGTVYQAMAVRDGRIVELGPERQILNRYAAKKVVDAAGRAVYPGFIDGHCHFFGYGLNKQKVDLTGVTWWKEAVDRTLAFAKANPGDEWILGRGWDENKWPMAVMPDNALLNQLFPDRPVLLQRVDGHAAVVNQAALTRVGLEPGTRIEGGLMVMKDGKPTGLLVDNAVAVFQKIFDEANEATKRKALLEAQADCFDVGLTMVCDAGLDVGTIELIRTMQREGALRMRVYAMVADGEDNLAHFAKNGPIKDERLVVRSVKVYADGALGSRGALLKQPYSDEPGHHGLQLASREHFLEVAQWCKEHDFQMNTHCIGDSANKLLLDVYGEVLGGTNDLRWRIEHAQVLSPEDRPKFGAFSIIPSVQPTHATSDGPWAETRLGPERIKHAYAYKDLRKTMGLLALGTDFPVEGIDPLATFRAAVDRQDGAGWPEGGYMPMNALSVGDALRGMTIWNAIATFTEKDLGSLEPGKWADFVIMEGELIAGRGNRKTKVSETYLAGERVK